MSRPEKTTTFYNVIVNSINLLKYLARDTEIVNVSRVPLDDNEFKFHGYKLLVDFRIKSEFVSEDIVNERYSLNVVTGYLLKTIHAKYTLTSNEYDSFLFNITKEKDIVKQ